MSPPPVLLQRLREAAEIEHALGLQYLYAAYSLKPRYAALFGAPRPGSTSLMGIALEEMHHLRLVNDILMDLGEPPHLRIHRFPIAGRAYPFPFELEPLSLTSLAKYVYAEAPAGAFTRTEKDASVALEALVAECLRMPAIQLVNVSSLYTEIIEIIDQNFGSEHPLKPVWLDALTRIKDEGEEGHFTFFCSLLTGSHPDLGAPSIWQDPSADAYPSFAFVRNPRADDDPTLTGTSRALGQIGNRLYWAVLLMLGASYDQRGANELHLRSVDLMVDGLMPVAQALAGKEIGLPFEPLTASADDEALKEGDARLRYAAVALDEATAHVSNLDDHALGWNLRDVIAAARASVRFVATESSKRRALSDDMTFVVGAGPAGIAAALALVKRGEKVTLVEQDEVVGGKAWSRRASPDDRASEHGIHGWWPSYVNFDRMLKDADVNLDDAFRVAEGAGLVTPSGKVVAVNRVPFPLPSPLHLAIYVLRLPFIGLREALSAVRFMVHAVAFDHERDYRRYDDESFSKLLLRLGVAETVRSHLLGPFAVGFDYARPEDVSASSVLSALQFYTLPDQNRIVPRWPRGLPNDVVFAPLLAAFERAGGVVVRGAEVERFVIEGGRIAGLVLKDRLAPERRRACVHEISQADIPADGVLETHAGPAGPVIVARVGDRVRAWSARCPHRGDRVEWQSCVLRCRGHSSEFNARGELVRGPATAGLESLEVQAGAETVRIIAPPHRRQLRCRQAVLALDVRRAKAVLDATQDVPEALRGILAKLRATSVVVIRLWFASGVSVPPHETIVMPASQLGDVFFNVSRITPGLENEGFVVELHSTDARAALVDR